MKYFRMSYEEVVFKRSYLNVLLLNRSIPTFKLNDDDKQGGMSRTNRTKGYTKSKRKFHNETELFMSMM